MYAPEIFCYFDAMTPIFVLLSSLAFAADKSSLLDAAPELRTECVCEVSEALPPHRVLFAADAGSSALIRIKGKVVNLELIQSDQMLAKKKGDSFSFKYKSGKIVFKFQGKRSSSCAQSKPDCMNLTGDGQVFIEEGLVKETVNSKIECFGCD